MSNLWSFLVPYAANPNMLEACLHSIRTYYSDEQIIVCLRTEDPYRGAGQFVADKFKAEVIEVPGKGDNTDLIMRALLEGCATRYATYMEADCLLLKPLYELRMLVERMQRVLAGVIDVIPWPEGREGTPVFQSYFRYAPGFFSASFWASNIELLKQEIGLDCIRPDGSQYCYEPYYGLSAAVRAADWWRFGLHVQHLDKQYGFATSYADYVVHSWFGAWRLRPNIKEASGIDWTYLHACESQLLADYWRGDLNARFSDELSS